MSALKRWRFTRLTGNDYEINNALWELDSVGWLMCQSTANSDTRRQVNYEVVYYCELVNSSMTQYLEPDTFASKSKPLEFS
ncbi:hypothetical protein ACOMICROBIO_FLGHMIGD_03579 [Vibrio sp. B1FLJ16]|nr:hypothetical protein ACOMICROBIO_FLGHMIGD_03579 [Vibrio sp. B1FLJ16]CAE6932804.1 hypothetical protein ACOMICROBIO_FLGHMIGD_03579 [Vibrio sp. B1FLJ16]